MTAIDTAVRDRIQAALYESDLVDLTFAGDLADVLLPLVTACVAEAQPCQRVRQAYADGYEWALAHLHDEAVQADLARIAGTAPRLGPEPRPGDPMTTADTPVPTTPVIPDEAVRAAQSIEYVFSYDQDDVLVLTETSIRDVLAAALPHLHAAWAAEALSEEATERAEPALADWHPDFVREDGESTWRARRAARVVLLAAMEEAE